MTTEITNDRPTDERIDELEDEVTRLERRLDYLEGLSVEDIDPPEHVDEQLLRGSLKVDRRKIRAKLKTKREQLEAAREANE